MLTVTTIYFLLSVGFKLVALEVFIIVYDLICLNVRRSWQFVRFVDRILGGLRILFLY